MIAVLAMIGIWLVLFAEDAIAATRMALAKRRAARKENE